MLEYIYSWNVVSQLFRWFGPIIGILEMSKSFTYMQIPEKKQLRKIWHWFWYLSSPGSVQHPKLKETGIPAPIWTSLLSLSDYVYMMPRPTAEFLGGKTLISPINRQQCWAWTTRIQNWTVLDQWSSIGCCDDSRFGLSSDDNRWDVGGHLEKNSPKILCLYRPGPVFP